MATEIAEVFLETEFEEEEVRSIQALDISAVLMMFNPHLSSYNKSKLWNIMCNVEGSDACKAYKELKAQGIEFLGKKEEEIP